MSSSQISNEAMLELVLNSTLESIREILHADFICPICNKICEDAHLNPDCSHRFCGKCIKERLYHSNKNCPTCGCQITDHTILRSDWTFNRICEKIQDITPPLVKLVEDLSEEKINRAKTDNPNSSLLGSGKKNNEDQPVGTENRKLVARIGKQDQTKQDTDITTKSSPRERLQAVLKTRPPRRKVPNAGRISRVLSSRFKGSKNIASHQNACSPQKDEQKCQACRKMNTEAVEDSNGNRDFCRLCIKAGFVEEKHGGDVVQRKAAVSDTNVSKEHNELANISILINEETDENRTGHQEEFEDNIKEEASRSAFGEVTNHRAALERACSEIHTKKVGCKEIGMAFKKARALYRIQSTQTGKCDQQITRGNADVPQVTAARDPPGFKERAMLYKKQRMQMIVKDLSTNRSGENVSQKAGAIAEGSVAAYYREIQENIENCLSESSSYESILHDDDTFSSDNISEDSNEKIFNESALTDQIEDEVSEDNAPSIANTIKASEIAGKLHKPKSKKILSHSNAEQTSSLDKNSMHVPALAQKNSTLSMTYSQPSQNPNGSEVALPAAEVRKYIDEHSFPTPSLRSLSRSRSTLSPELAKSIDNHSTTATKHFQVSHRSKMAVSSEMTLSGDEHLDTELIVSSSGKYSVTAKAIHSPPTITTPEYPTVTSTSSKYPETLKALQSISISAPIRSSSLAKSTNKHSTTTVKGFQITHEFAMSPSSKLSPSGFEYSDSASSSSSGEHSAITKKSSQTSHSEVKSASGEHPKESKVLQSPHNSTQKIQPTGLVKINDNHSKTTATSPQITHESALVPSSSLTLDTVKHSDSASSSSSGEHSATTKKSSQTSHSEVKSSSGEHPKESKVLQGLHRSAQIPSTALATINNKHSKTTATSPQITHESALVPSSRLTLNAVKHSDSESSSSSGEHSATTKSSQSPHSNTRTSILSTGITNTSGERSLEPRALQSLHRSAQIQPTGLTKINDEHSTTAAISPQITHESALAPFFRLAISAGKDSDSESLSSSGEHSASKKSSQSPHTNTLTSTVSTGIISTRGGHPVESRALQSHREPSGLTKTGVRKSAVAKLPQRPKTSTQLDKARKIRLTSSLPRRNRPTPCSGKWNPYAHKEKKGCEACLMVLSIEEQEEFFTYGRHVAVTRTSGGCTDGCCRYKGPRFYEDENEIDDFQTAVLCRMCYLTVHKESRASASPGRRRRAQESRGSASPGRRLVACKKSMDRSKEEVGSIGLKRQYYNSREVRDLVLSTRTDVDES